MFSDKAPAPHDKTLVLLSGGLDSAVTLALAKANTCKQVFTMSFDYGQKHVKELLCSKALAEHYDTNHRVVPVSNLQNYSGLRPEDSVEPATISGADSSLPLLPRTWKPGRNMLFLTHGAIFAWWAGIHLMAVGVHSEDQPNYPDCGEFFLICIEQALQAGMSYTFNIWAPLLKMDKVDIVGLGLSMGVPFEKTWSCYAGGEVPCGKCDACTRRAHGFLGCGVNDPLLKEVK